MHHMAGSFMNVQCVCVHSGTRGTRVGVGEGGLSVAVGWCCWSVLLFPCQVELRPGSPGTCVVTRHMRGVNRVCPPAKLRNLCTTACLHALKACQLHPCNNPPQFQSTPPASTTAWYCAACCLLQDCILPLLLVLASGQCSACRMRAGPHAHTVSTASSQQSSPQ